MDKVIERDRDNIQ